jgi:hypothetical protein
MHSFQQVVNNGRGSTSNLSMEILTSSIIDEACERLKREVGLNPLLGRTKRGSFLTILPSSIYNNLLLKVMGVGLVLGSAVLTGFLLGRTSPSNKRG